MSDDHQEALGQGANLGQRVASLLQFGQFDRARDLALQVISERPDEALGHLLMAQVALSEGNLPVALTAVEIALSREPSWDGAHAVRAQVLRDLGRFSEAEEALLVAISLDPSWPEHHARLGMLLWECERPVAALAQVELALSLDPDSARLHSIRSVLLLQVSPRDWTVTREAAEDSLRVAPNDPTAHAVLGTVLMRDGDRERAESSFRTALQIDPNNPLAFQGLSELVMERYPWYRPMFAFNILMGRFGQAGQLGVIFGAWALYRSVMTATSGIESIASFRDLLFWVYLAFCGYTWFAEPITRALVRRHHPWLRG